MLKKFQKEKPLLILLGILAVAAFLRLYRIDVLMRFIWDEGRDMMAIRSIIVNHDLTLFGPFNEIGGKKDFFGVFHYYLMLPALWVANFNPVGPAIFTALLGVASVGLTYIWAKKWLTVTQTLIVASLMAISPLAVTYTRWPWNPNTTGFFGIAYLLLLQRWQQRPKFLISLLSGVTLGLLFQLHYFTIALSAAAFVTVWWQKNLSTKQKTLHFLSLGLGFGIPNLSFVIFDVTHDGFYRKILIDSFSGSNASQQYFFLNPLQIFIIPPQYIFEVCHKFFGNGVLGIPAVIIFIIWLFQSLKKGMKVQVASEEFQLAVSWIAFLIIITLFPTLKDDYHSASLWLAIPIATIVITKKFWKSLPSKLNITVLVAITLFLILQNRFWREPNWSENMPKLQRISTIIADDAKNTTGINIASLVDSDTRATRFRYFAAVNGVTLDSIDSYPQSKILYVISPHSWEESRNNPPWELETFKDSQATVIAKDSGWNLFKIEKE